MPVGLWLVALVLAVALFNLARYHAYVVDDTYISLRYARNLVEGHGLVFNPGERVEGYTNFLFVVLAALFMRLGLDPIVAAKSVSAAMAVVTLLVVARMERAGPCAMRRLPVSLVLLLPLPAFAYWALGSFETMLFTGLFVTAVACLLHESRVGYGQLSAGLFVFLALTRPEGLYLFALCSLVFLLVDAWLTPRRAVLRRHALNAVLFALGFGPYFLWRCWYYGRLLPNTFYAKVTGGREQLATGLLHLSLWAQAFPLLAAMLLLPLALLFRAGRAAARRHPPFVALYVIALAHTAYIVLVGGDFMPYFRFFLPIIPLCCLLLAWTLGAAASASAAGGRVAHSALFLVLLVTIAASHATNQPYVAFVAHRTTVVGEWVGRWFRSRLQPDDLIAVNTAGSLPYYAGLPTIDMLGLTDAQIAARPIFIISTGWAGHRKGWGEYVVNRRPRIIVWYNTAGSREPFYLGDHELADNPFFRFFYQPRTVRLPLAPGREEGQVVARFLGDPFDVGKSKTTHSGDLGLNAVIAGRPFRYTVFSEGPVVINYFEFDARDTDLWSLKAGTGTIDEFVRAAAQIWRAARPLQPGDAAAQAEVEAMCEQALRRIETEDYANARSLLTVAAQRNAAARSPLVYQYIANLAVMTGDLWVAVGAQKEALRLAPDNPLYLKNLRSLLTRPYKEAARPRGILANP